MVYGFWFRVKGLVSSVSYEGMKVQCVGYNLGFSAQGSGFRVEGLGFRV